MIIHYSWFIKHAQTKDSFWKLLRDLLLKFLFVFISGTQESPVLPHYVHLEKSNWPRDILVKFGSNHKMLASGEIKIWENLIDWTRFQNSVFNFNSLCWWNENCINQIKRVLWSTLNVQLRRTRVIMLLLLEAKCCGLSWQDNFEINFEKSNKHTHPGLHVCLKLKMHH